MRKPPLQPFVLHRETVKTSTASIKTTYRDIAARYIQRFGGDVFIHQTDIDACDVYLRNCFGLAIAKVSPFDKFPKPPPAHYFSEIPY